MTHARLVGSGTLEDGGTISCVAFIKHAYDPKEKLTFCGEMTEWAARVFWGCSPRGAL